MPGIVRMQSIARSRLDRAQLISFDREVIEKSTAPLIHREARYWFITRGRGTLRLQNGSFALFPGTLVSVLPWQVTEITEVTEPLQLSLIVYHLDTLTRLMKSFYDEAELAAGLPNDPSRAAALVQQRLRDGGQALQRRIGSAYQGVADAWGLGIAKVPAVVVDRRYVVYGETDVARAVARIESHRRAQP